MGDKVIIKSNVRVFDEPRLYPRMWTLNVDFDDITRQLDEHRAMGKLKAFEAEIHLIMPKGKIFGYPVRFRNGK